MWLLDRCNNNEMFDLCSDTESAKTIKQLRDVVDSLSARLRAGGLRSQQSASDVQALHKQISLALGSQMAEGQDMEEDDVFGRSIVLKIRKDTVVGQETLAQSGGLGPRTL